MLYQRRIAELEHTLELDTPQVRHFLANSERREAMTMSVSSSTGRSAATHQNRFSGPGNRRISNHHDLNSSCPIIENCMHPALQYGLPSVLIDETVLPRVRQAGRQYVVRPLYTSDASDEEDTDVFDA